MQELAWRVNFNGFPNRERKRIEVMPVAWWWSVLLFIAGACVGAVLMGVCAYDKVHSGKRWWEDDDQ